jgi:hypothetical protein
MFSKLKQFKDLRQQAKDWQGKMAVETVTTNAAFGKVKLTLNGNLEMTEVQIDPELLAPDKKDKLQVAIKDAHNDAIKKIQRIMAMKIREDGGMPKIPGLS